jgi:hypothetical protein
MERRRHLVEVGLAGRIDRDRERRRRKRDRVVEDRGASLSDRVALVDVAVSFGCADVARTDGVRVLLLLPRRKKIWPTRSVSPFVASNTCEL